MGRRRECTASLPAGKAGPTLLTPATKRAGDELPFCVGDGTGQAPRRRLKIEIK